MTDKNQKKTKPGFNMPPAVLDAFAELVDALPEGKGKSHWALATAAFLLLFETAPDVRDYYMQQAGAADMPGGSYEDLIDRAKTGDLRKGYDAMRSRQAARLPAPRLPAEPPPRPKIAGSRPRVGGA